MLLLLPSSTQSLLRSLGHTFYSRERKKFIEEGKTVAAEKENKNKIFSAIISLTLRDGLKDLLRFERWE
jgi:hypothetical protein